MNNKLVKSFGEVVMDSFKDLELSDATTFEDLYDVLKNWAVSDAN